MTNTTLQSVTFSAKNGNTPIQGELDNLGYGEWVEQNNQGGFFYTDISQNNQNLNLYDSSRSLELDVRGSNIYLSYPGVSNYQYGKVLTETSTRNDGATVISVKAPGQAVYSDYSGNDVFNANHQPSTDFVFTPGFSEATINGFVATGNKHDVLDLPASDFYNIADVLRNTNNTSGGAIITDPTTGDTIKLVGVTKSTLSQHKSDFALV